MRRTPSGSSAADAVTTRLSKTARQVMRMKLWDIVQGANPGSIQDFVLSRDVSIVWYRRFLGPGNLCISFNHEDPIAHLSDSNHCGSDSFGSWPLLRTNQRMEAIVQRQRHERWGTGGPRQVRGGRWKIKNGGRHGYAALPGGEVWRRRDTRAVHR